MIKGSKTLDLWKGMS